MKNREEKIISLISQFKELGIEKQIDYEKYRDFLQYSLRDVFVS